MTISLQNKEEQLLRDVRSIADKLLSTSIVSLERMGGGLNSRVYQLGARDASKYLLKFYYRDHPGDQRDRLRVEFSSLTFLWENGIRSIPQPITLVPEEHCAIYQFIEGKKISADEIQSRDIESAIHFLAELKSLKAKAKSFSCASEAFFSMKDLNTNLQRRVERLQNSHEDSQEYDAMKYYLNHDFIPFWKTLIPWAQKNLSDIGISFDDMISEHDKTLSPSDFGFHNALRDKAGRIVFLDFEHFGWDDPAKIISDFLLHPAMTLKRDFKQQFVTGILELFKECEQLKYRVKILYPFFGLKWCLIFLNEFTPENLGRRYFAQMEAVNKQHLLREQLLKAQQMLNNVKQTYRAFPYQTSFH